MKHSLGKMNSDSSESNPNPQSDEIQKEKKEDPKEKKGKGLISPISNQNREKNQIRLIRTLTKP